LKLFCGISLVFGLCIFSPPVFAAEQAQPIEDEETEKKPTTREDADDNPKNIFQDLMDGFKGRSGKIELETDKEGKTQDKRDTLKKTINKFIFNDKHLGISGYMDTYAAYSLNNPTTNTRRPYNSNPEYVDHVGMAYGYISFEYVNENVRARTAIQGGEIVERMYIGERADSGVKLFREANAGYAFSKNIALDMGIFPSFYGAESFINKDNQHASRAIMTDFAPDYAAGMRLNYEPSQRWEFKFEISNGWQNISNPHQMAFGALAVFKPSDKATLNYATYLGNEALVGQAMILRSYHDFYAKIVWGNFTFIPMVDYFFERRDAEGRTVWGLNAGISIRYAFNALFAIAARYELLYDPNEIIPDLHANAPYGVPGMASDGTQTLGTTAPAPGGFQADGYTLTLEYLPSEHMTIRLEGRYTKALNPIYIRGNNQPTNDDAIIYSSFAVGF